MNETTENSSATGGVGVALGNQSQSPCHGHTAVLWGEFTDFAGFQQRLMYAVGSLYPYLRIVRARQHDRTTRYDINVECRRTGVDMEEAFKLLLRRLKRCKRRFGWVVRANDPQAIRQRSRLPETVSDGLEGHVLEEARGQGVTGAQPGADGDGASGGPGGTTVPSSQGGEHSTAVSNVTRATGNVTGESANQARTRSDTKFVAFGSWNINGFRYKKYEVMGFLQDTRLDFLALQETLLPHEAPCVRLPGYRAFEQRGDLTSGNRGVALLVKRDYAAVQMRCSADNFLVVRVSGNGLPRPVVLVSVYRVMTRPVKVVLEELRRRLWNLVEACPVEEILVMGDFNRSRGDIERLVRDVHDGFRVLTCVNARTSRRNGRSVIDHVGVLCRGARTGVSRYTLCRKQYSGSDHWPVTGALTVDKAVEPPEPWKRVRYNIRDILHPPRGEVAPSPTDAVASIQNHNLFAVLADGVESGEIEADVGASRLHDVLGEVFKSYKCQQSESARPRYMVSRKVLQLIKQRAVAANRAADARREVQRRANREKAEALTKEIRQLIREERRLFLRGRLLKAGVDLKSDPRAFWEYVRGWLRRPTLGEGGLCPVRDPASGQLAITPEAIVAAWANHYRELAKDTSGMGCDLSLWGARLAHVERHDETIVELDADISAEEVVRVVGKLKNNKAAGMDGLPAELYKLLGRELDVETGSEEDGGRVYCPAVRALTAVVNRCFCEASIPPVWQDSVVVSLYKKGDAEDPSNYRGISLMAVGMKVLTRVVANRLQREFERLELFDRGQAGFRTLEECPIQAGTLYEICFRRKESLKRPTLLCFVDLQKAYDTVPHGALLFKLSQFGVRGRMLGFIQALYSNSYVRVRCGASPCFFFSERFRLERGLRQGCPLSPILFNIFFNDVAQYRTPKGVRVQKNCAVRVPSLMFADDLVMLESGVRRMKRRLRRLTEWLDAHMMRANAAKCGVMLVYPDLHSGTAVSDVRFKVQGTVLPVVKEYLYLGLRFTERLDIGEMVKARIAYCRVKLGSMRQFLEKSEVPLPMKSMAIKCCLAPVVLYGSELFGMAKALTDRGQTIINTAARWALGMSAGGASMACLWRELGLQPICAWAAARRARACNKVARVRTWIAALVPFPFRGRAWSWLSGTERWLQRYAERLIAVQEILVQGMKECAVCADPVEAFAAVVARAKAVRDGREPVSAAVGPPLPSGWWRQCAPKLVGGIVRDMVIHRELLVWDCPSLRRYLAFRFPPLGCVVLPGMARYVAGVRQVVLMRLGLLPTAARLARRGLVSPLYLNLCPFCAAECPDGYFHLVVECPAFASERVLIGSLLEQVIGTGTGWVFANGDVVALVLGGTVRGFVVVWSVGASCPQVVELAGHDVEFGAGVPSGCGHFGLALAHFLQRAGVERRRVLGRLRGEWLTDLTECPSSSEFGGP
jgi:hypothetical protein